MKLPRHSPVAYNPHLLRREALMESFVARQPLLDELLDDLRRGGKQHHLLIGPRGSGKTTFLLRLGFAIEDDAKLARRAIALRFPEEQYNVGQLSDFWLNCADALVDALERRGDPDAVRALEKQIELIELLPEADRAPEALKLLTDWTHRSKRSLVLLVDNLDLILDRLDAAHWPLRETFSADNGLVLVGASSSFIQDAFAYDSPFYDFFNVHDLGPLTEAEGRALILRLAETTGTPHVARTIEEDPGRFTALFILSGGSPRTLTLLHGVLARDQTARAEQDLEHLLDTVTPYYKARFDDLPAQSQLIVNAVALHWHPMTAAECAAETRIDVSQVSAQLNRLVRQGVLSKVPGAEPKLAFQVTERFFNIWYLMRASRRMRRKLLWLVNFLHAFYGEAEVERRAAELLASPEGRAAAADPARLLAFATATKDATLRRRLEVQAVHVLVEQQTRGTPLGELLDLDGEDAHLRPVLDRVGAIRELRRAITGPRGTPGHAERTAIADAVAGQPVLPLRFKRVLAGACDQPGTRGEAFVRDLLEHAPRIRAAWGEELCAAIGRGEVPTLVEVTTLAEAEALVTLAPPAQRDAVVNAMLSGLIAREMPLELFDQVAALWPFPGGTLVVLAGFEVLAGRLPRALHVLRSAAEKITPADVEILTQQGFWRVFARQGVAGEVVAVLEASSAGDALAPLVEALRAVAEGRTAPLTGLAPEIRAPAEAILAGLLAPDPAPAPTVGPSPARAVPRPRRKPLRSSRAPRRRQT